MGREPRVFTRSRAVTYSNVKFLWLRRVYRSFSTSESPRFIEHHTSTIHGIKKLTSVKKSLRLSWMSWIVNSVEENFAGPAVHQNEDINHIFFQIFQIWVQ